MIEGLTIVKSTIHKDLWWIGWEGRLIGRIREKSSQEFPFPVFVLEVPYDKRPPGINLYKTPEDAAETFFLSLFGR